ncbi:DUF4054 domain-containing protein [Salmonella enterica]|nr:DUF4054 domain-containing protein [Salmonella enterica]
MEFTVRYPEFASVAPARIDGALQDASNQMNRKVWNKLYEQGLHALAAHLLYAAGALTPSGSSNGKPVQSMISRSVAGVSLGFSAPDGHDYINAFTSRTVRGKDQVVDSVLQDMPNTKKGSVTKQQALIRPKVLVGSSSKILTDMLLPDESFFIKDERVHILKANEVTSGNIPVVNARSGLLNTPQATKISAQDDGGQKGQKPTNDPETDPGGSNKEKVDSSTLAPQSKGQIVFDTKLNPMLVIGGLCAIESVTNPALNGVYKIYQVETSGQNNGAAWYQKVVCQPAGNYAVIK